MSSLSPSAPLALPATAPAAAHLVSRLLGSLRSGCLDVQWPDGSMSRFIGSDAAGARASIRLTDWSVCACALKSGDIGFAESYIAGEWTTPDLPALLKLLVVNRDDIERMVYGRWWGRLLHRVRHLLNRNSRRGSRKNIHAHYDLGNPFYALWLDPRLIYSSAWFDGDHRRSLPDAQQAKLQRALTQCELRPGDRLLEIGCGWGALAQTAAADHGALVTGVTLSAEQLALARQRLADAGLGERAELRLQDYREIDDAPFDAIASIEMFEAVGREYWPAFFATVNAKLKPGGRACIQTITIRDDLFDRYVAGTDFIQQYVFPGGLLPSPSQFRLQARAAGLEVVDEMAFGTDYAETLRRWRASFLAEHARVLQVGFDERFIRIWDFYLAYCEAAFDEGNTDVIQFTLRKP